MKAKPVFQEKRLVSNPDTRIAAVVEIKIWEVPKSKEYPTGRKYSLFLVANGETVVGLDNHKPKGPLLHLGERELPYLYRDDRKLLADFWDFVRKAGFEV